MKRLLCFLSGVWLLVGCAHQATTRRQTTYTPRVPRPSAPPPLRVVSPPPPKPSLPGPADEETRELRRKIVAIAQRGYGKSRIRCGARIRLRRDCSGWVRCVYSHLRLDLMRPPETSNANGVLLMKRFVEHYGTFHKAQKPALGDLVFWHYTYDKNRNGLLDDMWTHIGIVEAVEESGRIAVLHYDGKVKRAFMHLGQPGIHMDPLRTTQKAPVSSTCTVRRMLFQACRKRYGMRGCRWSHSRMKRACKGASSQTTTATLNSYLVNPRKAGLMYGKYTGELFGGFGTVLQIPLPFHLRKNHHAVSKISPTLLPTAPSFSFSTSFPSFP